ncbi:MAG: AarF/ABC1/UbiB kinase family protein [Deltaproteobacteria bacterium]|nr:MAG: AarF/ABC1/UbiB kinase family protein [Deltaproteobacteria bacterium]
MPHVNVSDLPRLREIGVVLARHGFGQAARLAGLDVEGGGISHKLPLGRRLRMVLADLGPTFVKLGQILSVRPDIVPRDVMEELATLQDDVPPADPAELRQLLERELGAPVDQRFQVFDPEPLASASIAQVHRAVLRDGTEVAVKVQRPGIEERIRSDLHILYTLAQLLQGSLELPGLYTPVGIVREFDAALTRELDFIQEAQAATRFRSLFAGNADVTAPRIFEEWSTRRLLVMELIEGRRIVEFEGTADAEPIMDKVIAATYAQVFDHGFFHGDPHPGNLLVTPEGRIAYLDFGITGQLTGEMQDTLVQLFLALVFQDAESLALGLYRAGATEGRVDLKGFRGEIARLMAKYHGASLGQLSEAASLVEFVQVAARYRIRLVPEYAVLARATSLLDGLARRMLPDVDIVERVKPYAQRLLGSRLSPERLTGDTIRLLQHAQVAARDVPLQLNQLMLDLERGNMTLTIRDAEGDKIREDLRHVGTRVAIAAVAGALVVADAIMLAAWGPAPFGVPIVALAVFGTTLMASLAMWALVIHVVAADQLNPRRLRRAMLAVLRFLAGGRR